MKTMKQFFEWSEHVLAPQLRASQWYNGQWLPGQRGFIDDRNNRIMGYATMRQLRIKKGIYFNSTLIFTYISVLSTCNFTY